MEEQIQYHMTSDPPTVTKGVFTQGEGVAVGRNDNCMKLDGNKVGISYEVKITQGKTLVVSHYAEAHIWRPDGGVVELKMIVVSLWQLAGALSEKCEEYMKDEHEYTFKAPVPTQEEVEVRVLEHLTRQN